MNLYGMRQTDVFFEQLNAAPEAVREAVLRAMYEILGGPYPGLCDLNIEPLAQDKVEGLFTVMPRDVIAEIYFRVRDEEHAVEFLTLEWGDPTTAEGL